MLSFFLNYYFESMIFLNLHVIVFTISMRHALLKNEDQGEKEEIGWTAADKKQKRLSKMKTTFKLKETK